MQTSGTVINPSRFQSSHNLVGVGQSQTSNNNKVSLVDTARDPDFQFLRSVKDCLIKFNSATLVQGLPSSALTDFHFYWLSALATTKEESRSLVKHIISTYATNLDPMIKLYYSQKIDRLLGIVTPEDDVLQEIDE